MGQIKCHQKELRKTKVKDTKIGWRSYWMAKKRSSNVGWASFSHWRTQTHGTSFGLKLRQLRVSGLGSFEVRRVSSKKLFSINQGYKYSTLFKREEREIKRFQGERKMKNESALVWASHMLEPHSSPSFFPNCS